MPNNLRRHHNIKELSWLMRVYTHHPRSLIVALGGNSRTRALQRIGRLVRPYPAKDVTITFDIWDSAEFLHKQASQEEAV